MGEGVQDPCGQISEGGNGKSADGVRQSFAQALKRPLQQPKFRLPLRKPEKINGEFGFVFSDLEMDRAAEDLKFALVLKFTSTRLSIDVLRLNIIKTWGFREVPMISFMDDHHVLLHLANETDYVHAWAREGRIVAGCQFRLFNWTIDFDVKKEPSIAPQWIFLPGLPLHLYRLDCLQSFATRFGRFLGTDNATLYRTRATGARICVEVDLQDEMVDGFPIVVGQKHQIWQEVVYEKRGFYCNKCFRQGHTAVVCRMGLKPKQKTEKINGGKLGIKKDEKSVWKVVDWKKPLEDGEVEVVEGDRGDGKEEDKYVEVVIDKGKQVLIDQSPDPDFENGMISGGIQNGLQIDIVPLVENSRDENGVCDDSGVVIVLNGEAGDVLNNAGVTGLEEPVDVVPCPNGDVVISEPETVIEANEMAGDELGIAGETEFDKSEEVDPCQNGVEVLFEEETAKEVNCEKDYCSDPKGSHESVVGIDVKEVSVRKSRKMKVQPNKLKL